MKIEYSLLTLLSASMVAAAPAPFVVTDPVAATGTENVAIPVTGFDRRQQVSVYGFRKRTLELRNALLAARGQRQNQASGDDENNDAEDAQEDAAAGEQAIGKSKDKDNNEQAAALPTLPETPAAPGNTTEPAGKGKGKGKGAAEEAAAPPAPPVAANATEPVGKGKGKGKGAAEEAAGPPAPPAAANATEPAAGKGKGKGEGKGKGKTNQEGAAADQEFTLLGQEEAGGNTAGMSPHSTSIDDLLKLQS